MQYIFFGEQRESYDVAVLIKSSAFNKTDLENHYVSKINQSCIGFDLAYNSNNKAPVKQMIEPYLDELQTELELLKVKVLLVADTNYFKKLTGMSKADSYYGYVLDGKYKGYENMKIVLVPNYQAVFFDPKVGDKITLGLDALSAHLGGSYKEVGKGIIHSAQYVPCNAQRVRKALSQLYRYPSITLDTETFSLKANRAGLGTIGFAWDEHNGICIDVEHGHKTTGLTFGARRTSDWEVAGVMIEIKYFLENYKGNIKYHNATYDIKVLIRTLWMKHLTDNVGLLEGLEVLTRDFDCTQAITFLATNSAAGNKLSLKDQSQEFLGKYSVDVNDIRKQPTRPLCLYNLKDCLATWFVYKKNYPIMVKDEQLEYYNNMAKPILKNFIQTELTGMPLDIRRVDYVANKLKNIIRRYSNYINNTSTVKKFTHRKREEEVIERNANYKTKVITIADAKYEFSTGSGQKIADLLHNYMGFEVLETTDTGLPATGADDLKGHMLRTDNKEYANILKSIIKVEEGKKILGTFINKFIDSERDDDGNHHLFGSFKFGGAKSYRISSSDPNMMNLPAHGIMGKLVKSCFKGHAGWIFAGLDYASLTN